MLWGNKEREVGSAEWMVIILNKIVRIAYNYEAMFGKYFWWWGNEPCRFMGKSFKVLRKPRQRLWCGSFICVFTVKKPFVIREEWVRGKNQKDKWEPDYVGPAM